MAKEALPEAAVTVVQERAGQWLPWVHQPEGECGVTK